MFREPKYVIFIWFLLHPNFSTKRSGLPDFYSVKLDVIWFTQKPYFWNPGTSYINALCLISHELEGQFLERLQMNRGVVPAIQPGGEKYQTLFGGIWIPLCCANVSLFWEATSSLALLICRPPEIFWLQPTRLEATATTFSHGEPLLHFLSQPRPD